MSYTWVEPFAGAAAVALRLVGGKHLLPPVAWMGGKRRYARAIADAKAISRNADRIAFGIVEAALSVMQVARFRYDDISGEQTQIFCDRFIEVVDLETQMVKASLHPRLAEIGPVFEEGEIVKPVA